MSHADEPVREAGSPTAAASRTARFRFPWKSTIAIAAIVLLGLPIYSTLQPQYYERYPQLRGRIEAWAVSTHGKIPCYGCHMNPGIGGFLEFSARAIPGFYEQLIWGPNSQNILQTPHREACQKCHTDYRQVSPAGDLMIPHRAHVEILKIDCPTCHKNLVHSLNSQGYNTPEMQTCIGLCHNGVKATNQCSKCHTQKAMPPSHLAKNWLDIHPTMTTKINCGQCHAWSPNFCQQCHLSKLPPSHVGNWKQNHQFRAHQIGTNACLFCHGSNGAFCLKCHDHVPVVKTP